MRSYYIASIAIMAAILVGLLVGVSATTIIFFLASFLTITLFTLFMHEDANEKKIGQLEATIHNMKQTNSIESQFLRDAIFTIQKSRVEELQSLHTLLTELAEHMQKKSKNS